MATEITYVATALTAWGRRIRRLGGAGWIKDEEIVIAEIEEGREFFVEVDLVRFSVIVSGSGEGRGLRTDPAESASDTLVALPSRPLHGS